MGTPKMPSSTDLMQRGQAVMRQFRGLDLRDPAAWPPLPRLALFAGVAATLVAALWFVLISDAIRALEDERQQEVRLKSDFNRKLPQALNLEALRRQREQVRQQVALLEKQLPGRAEMDGLLSDINQAGLGRGLHFDLFRPGQMAVRTYYAELPIALKVAGSYHAIGAFAADVAGLSRIVTLNNLTITPGRDGLLVMEATAKTFRYLEPAEVTAQAKATAASAAAAGPR
ncbi:MAG: putative Tfp pilus assembly protein PilO [Pseudomonadota bacterium]